MPTWSTVNHYELGTREATDEEISAYVQAVARSSRRVRAGVLGQSGLGRPLPYALVSDPSHLTPRALSGLSSDLAHLRQGGSRTAAPPRAGTRPGGRLGDGQRSLRRAQRGGRRHATALPARRRLGLRRQAATSAAPGRAGPGREPRRAGGGNEGQRPRLRPQPRLVRAHPARDAGQACADDAVPARGACRPARAAWQRLLLPRPTPTRSTTRCPTPRCGPWTTCSGRRLRGRSPPPAGRSRAERHTTCSTWATPTALRPRCSGRLA